MPDWVKRAAQALAVVIGLSLLFAWFGVYNTRQVAFPARFGLWFMTMVIGWGASVFVIPWVRANLETRTPVALQVLVAAALISLPITGALLVLAGGEFSLFRTLVQFAYVLVVSLVVTSIGWLHASLVEIRDAGLMADRPAGTDPAAQFMQRLPVKYRTATLYAVSAEDHYLRVHTSLGEELVLMRLSDALRELSEADGLQTHRSWWVARAGVGDTRRGDGRLVLVLLSGAEAAVSRRYAGDVRAAGFG